MFSAPPLAVAFDFDGTMFDTEVIYDKVGGIMLEKRGKRLDPSITARMMGRKAEDALQIMIDSYGLDDTVDGLKQETSRLFLECISDGVPMMPGLLPLLDRLRAVDMPLAITTSSHRLLIEPILAAHQLGDRFQFMLTAEDVIESKPAPEIYLKAAERFGVEVGRMLVFEDSGVGTAAAVAAGAPAFAIPSKYTEHNDFSGALAVINGFDHPGVQEALGF